MRPAKRALTASAAAATSVNIAIAATALIAAAGPGASPANAQDLECAAPAHIDADRLPEADPELGQLRRFATGKGARVAVIDTGVAAHPQLRHLVPAGDFVDPQHPNPLLDCDSHGTVVAGIIAGSARGIAPDAELIAIRQTSAHYRAPARVEGEEAPGADPDRPTAGSLQTLADAINLALDQRARVINISVVSCFPPAVAGRVDTGPVDAALARAEAQGAVVVAAAGNASESCEPDFTVIPAHSPTVVAVGAREGDYALAEYSIPAPGPQLSAPGRVPAALSSNGAGWSRGTVAGKAVQPYAGTSFAAPAVTGAVALLVERYPSLSPAEVRALLGAAAQHGQGALDPLRIIQQLPPEPAAEHAVTAAASARPVSAARARLRPFAAALALLAIGALALRRSPHPR